MSTDCKKSDKFCCSNCDYKSAWKCNLTRHMERKHATENVSLPAENVSPNAENVSPVAENVSFRAENVSFPTENVSLNIAHLFECKDCKKTFKRTQNLKYHIPRCKGINVSLICEYCKSDFTCRSSKSRHLRICKIKVEVDSKVLVPVNETNTPNTLPNENTINQVTQNANTINNTNNNNTNNNVTINNNVIVYDPKHMEFLTDHITKQDFKKMAYHHDFSKVLTDYGTALLSRSENQCVRKTNLRSTSSAVHVGDDKWEYYSDRQVLPKLLSNIADNFNDVREHYKINIYKQLETFMIDVQAEAEDCHEDAEEEARLKALYKRAVSNVKHLLFNLTKQALVVKRKNHENKINAS